MLFRVQPPGAGEHVGGATCVHVMHDGLERFGRGSAGAQQRRKFLELLLYLWRECGNGGGTWTPEANERSGTCLGKGAARGRVQNLLFRGNYES